MVTLRPYQHEALETVMAALMNEPNVLLQAATGAGKTILFSELIKRWMAAYPKMRMLVLAHRKELITQAWDKLIKVWPEGFYKIGLACSGAGQVYTDKPVTIGSVQTLANRDLRQAPHLVIIDEVHRVPHLESKSQYHDLLAAYSRIYPQLRVLGVTATPFRMGHGYIYGGRCKEGRTNLFPDLAYQITLDDLIAQGYLVAIRGKEAEDISLELAAIKLTGGDYNNGELNKVMTRPVHIESAVQAYREYGEERKHCVVFACTIEHAELLTAALKRAGQNAACVHSAMNGQARDQVLEMFNKGRLRFLVNVGILTEGWDSPLVDLIILARPTKSPALFAQMIGRGTRLAEGKEDLLVLDLADCFKTHGNPSAPRVLWKSSGKKQPPVMKACPQCKLLCPPGARECGGCGYRWPASEMVDYSEPLILKDVVLKKKIPGQSTVLSKQVYSHMSSKGHRLLCLELSCKPGGPVKTFLDIEGQTGRWQRDKARLLWWNLARTEAPENVDDALSRRHELMVPAIVQLEKANGHKKVKGF